MNVTDFKPKSPSLTQRALGACFWTFSGTGFLALVEAVVMIVLARILTPRDFGVVSVAIVFIKLSEIVTQAGIGQAIVQRPNLETRHIRAGFTLCCIIGIVATATVAGLSRAIAGFFRTEELVWVLPVMSLGFLMQGTSVVAEGLMQRELRFRRLAVIEALSSGLGYGLLGIILALNNFGVWSLVIGNLAKTVVRSVLLLASARHSVLPRLDRRTVNELLYFGSGLTIARIFNTLAGQGDYLVVGRCLGAELLGVYSRAYQLMAMPANLFGLGLDKVIFPVMAMVQHDREKLATAYRRGLAVITLITLPMSVVMYVLAPEIIGVLFGPKWLETVVPFRVLSLGILFRTSYKMGDSLARATGAVYRRAWRQGVYAAAILAGAYAGQFWGLEWVATGVLVAVLINFGLMTHLSMQLTSVSLREIVGLHLPAILSTSIVLSASLASATILRRMMMPPLAVLLVSGAVVALIMFLAAHVAPRFTLGKEAKTMLRLVYGRLPEQVRVRAAKIMPSFIYS